MGTTKATDRVRWLRLGVGLGFVVWFGGLELGVRFRPWSLSLGAGIRLMVRG